MTTLIRTLFALLGPKRAAIAVGALTGALLVLTGAAEAVRAILVALGVPIN